MRNQTYFLTICLAALAVGAFAITNQSFWIDEGAAAIKATQPTLAGWWHGMRAESNSNLQLIFQLFYLWGWEKIFGSSEIALRASNLPWFVVGVMALAGSFPKNRRSQISVTLLALTNAFLWYYVSEARPYIVLFAFSALTTACLLRLRSQPQLALGSATWFHCFCLAIAGMCATSLIAVPWALGAIMAFAYWSGFRSALQTIRRFWLSSLLLAVAVAVFGVYYLWTIKLGARASDVGRTGFATLGFVLYELLGLAGLGPGRLLLRAEGLKCLLANAPALTLGLIAVLAIFGSALSYVRDKTTGRDLVFFGACVAVPAALLILAGVSMHMRLLGRHFMPLLPFLLAWEALGIQRLTSAKGSFGRFATAGALVVLLFSALEIRFASRHGRDDYRTATALARTALEAREKVWWLADEATAAYYNLPLTSADLTLRSVDTSLPASPVPDLICLSKPDIYDPHGDIRNYIRENHFQVTQTLMAFQIFVRPEQAR